MSTPPKGVCVDCGGPTSLRRVPRCRACFRSNVRAKALAEFWNRTDRSGECWVWTGDKLPTGYGVVRWKGLPHRHTRVHRIAWELARGPIPDGLWVLHRCDNPPCIRPDHLFLGTNADNMADMAAKGRWRPPAVPLLGERHPRSRLTDEAVRQIRARRRAGEPLAVIARDFGIAQTTVSGIALGHAWRHVA